MVERVCVGGQEVMATYCTETSPSQAAGTVGRCVTSPTVYVYGVLRTLTSYLRGAIGEQDRADQAIVTPNSIWLRSYNQ